MSLRSRLTLFFVVIVFVPVAAMTLWQWRVAAATAAGYEREALTVDGHAAGLVLRTQTAQAASAAQALAADPEVQAALVEPDRRALADLLDRSRPGDLLVAVTGAHGEVLALGGRSGPSLLPGAEPPRVETLLGWGPHGPGSGVLQRQGVPVERSHCRHHCLLGTVVAGVWHDNVELDRLRPERARDVQLTFVVGGRPVASTLGWLTERDEVPAADGPPRGPARRAAGARRDRLALGHPRPGGPAARHHRRQPGPGRDRPPARPASPAAAGRRRPGRHPARRRPGPPGVPAPPGAGRPGPRHRQG